MPGWETSSEVYHYPWPGSSLTRRLTRRRDFHYSHPPLQAALAACVRKHRPDLIHIQNWAVFRQTLFPCLGRLGIPTVMTVHDFSLLDPNPTGVPRTGITGGLRRLLDRHSMPRAAKAAFSSIDRFLCPSQALIDQLGAPPAKTRLHRLPVEVTAKAPSAPTIEPGGPLRLFFAGSYYPSKGVDILLQALARIEVAVELELAGGGPEENNLKELSLELNINHKVKFLGPLVRKEMEAAYTRCQVVVLPSRVLENSPLVLLEGGSFGRPALASDLGGIPELVQDPAHGWTFPSEDVDALSACLTSIAANPAEICKRGIALRAFVAAKFRPSSHWQQLAETYDELLK